MTDLEMTRLAAEAMGLEVRIIPPSVELWGDKGSYGVYDPLRNDAQCFVLVKLFGIRSHKDSFDLWHCSIYGTEPFSPPLGQTEDGNLNRAVVECVAKMQQTRTTVT